MKKAIFIIALFSLAFCGVSCTQVEGTEAEKENQELSEEPKTRPFPYCDGRRSAPVVKDSLTTE